MTDITFAVIAFALQLVSVYLGYQYLIHRVDGKCEVRRLLLPGFQLPCFCVMSAAFLAAAFVFSKGFLFGSDVFMRALMNGEVLIWLSVLSYVDCRERIIPNSMIGLGLIFWLVVVFLDIVVAGTPWKNVTVFSLLGGTICGGILFVVALLVKTALGMGDVKLFFVLGLLYGITDTYSILLFTVVIMAVFSVVLLITKKATVKTAIPMAPFVVIGFLLSILAGM